MFASVCGADNIVGSIVPPFPDGWKDEVGSCITDNFGHDNICEYSIGIVKEASQLILYIGRATSRIDPKKARWLVTDQMPYPNLPKGFHVVIALCERNGRLDETIVATVKTTDTEWYSIVHSAFRANLTTGRFETTTTKGVRCRNEGWGV